MGTINTEWRFIADIVSDKNHSVEIIDGTRILGALLKPDDGEGVMLELGLVSD